MTSKNNQKFDALMREACAAERADGLRALDALAPADETAACPWKVVTNRRPRKTLRVALVAAVAAAMLCTGVVAAWPTLQFGVAKDGASLSISVADSGDTRTAAVLTPIELGDLPEGDTVNWADDHLYCEIVNDAGQNVFIEKEPMTAEFSLTPVTDLETKEIDPEGTQRLVDNTVVLDSFDEVTEDVLRDNGFIAWPAGDCYYVVMRSTMPAGEVLEILQNMT